MEDVMRSLLFVPGSRPDRFGKAMNSRADLICIDLEDGVAAGDKLAARRYVGEYLKSDAVERRRVIVRINDPTTELGQGDLLELRALANLPKHVAVPKIDCLETIDFVLSQCQRLEGVMAFIESPLGLSRAFAIAAHKNVDIIAFGSADWSNEIGCVASWDALLYPRSTIIHAAVQGGCLPIADPWLAPQDDTSFDIDSSRLHELGFKGRIALHPREVALINQVFSPDQDTVADAKAILEAAKKSKEGAFLADGRIIDKPVVAKARSTVRMAEWIARHESTVKEKES